MNKDGLVKSDKKIMPPFAWVMLCTEQNMLIVPPFQCRSFTNYRSNSNEVLLYHHALFAKCINLLLFFILWNDGERVAGVCDISLSFLVLS